LVTYLRSRTLSSFTFICSCSTFALPAGCDRVHCFGASLNQSGRPSPMVSWYHSGHLQWAGAEPSVQSHQSLLDSLEMASRARVKLCSVSHPGPPTRNSRWLSPEGPTDTTGAVPGMNLTVGCSSEQAQLHGPSSRAQPAGTPIVDAATRKNLVSVSSSTTANPNLGE
jgi:hypothetical protein